MLRTGDAETKCWTGTRRSAVFHALAVASVTWTPACSSTSIGAPTFEARGISEVHGGRGRYDATSCGCEGSGSGDSQDSFSIDLDTSLRSIGLRTAIPTDVVDVVAGTDVHRIDGQHVQEWCVGLRKRGAEADSVTPYFEGLIRHGYGLETPAGSRDYDGFALDAGFLVRSGEHWFFDFGFGWEWTNERLPLSGGNERLRDFVFTFGVGFSF